MDELLVVCSRELGNELVAAECGYLMGGWPDAYGVARGRTLAYIHRAAYARTGVRCLARAKTLDGLVDRISHLSLDAADFSIEFLRLSKRAQIGKQSAIIALADAIDAVPNLNEPAHRFLLATQDDGLWFGEIVAEADRSYTRHDAKPYRTSCSLPSRLARALVNLITPPARTILNPCCGTGSILLEARAEDRYGIKGVTVRQDGHEIPPAMVEQALKRSPGGRRVRLSLELSIPEDRTSTTIKVRARNVRGIFSETRTIYQRIASTL